MKQKILEFVNQNQMIKENQKVVAAVSGGIDSLCLFFLLLDLKEQIPFSLHVLHVEHGIRGDESKEDAVFVEEICKEHGVSCTVISVDALSYAKENKMGLEEAARILRYQAFEDFATSQVDEPVVALAHHMEDNVETILFQMARGSGLTGLCGMDPVRRGVGVTYIRPLLVCHRSELEEYLNRRNIMHREDLSNQDLIYSRNRIRKNILPELEKINPKAISHIAGTANYMRELQEYFLSLVWKEKKQVYEWKNEELFLDSKKLKTLPMIIQRELMYEALVEMAGAAKDISSIHVESLMELVEKKSGSSLNLPYGIWARKEYQFIVFGCFAKDIWEGISVSKEQLEGIKESGETIVFPLETRGEEIHLSVVSNLENMVLNQQKTYTKCFCYDKIKEGFVVRTRAEGDRLEIGKHHKKLKRYFIDEKIPKVKRDQMLLLAVGSDVIWLIGERVSPSYLAMDQADAVLIVEYKKRRTEDEY